MAPVVVTIPKVLAVTALEAKEAEVVAAVVAEEEVVVVVVVVVLPVQ